MLQYFVQQCNGSMKYMSCDFMWLWELQLQSLTLPLLLLECRPLLLRVTKRIDSIWGKKESSRCERRRLYSLWTGNMLLSWRDDHSSSASPLPRMLTFISSIRCNSSVNQPMFRETERAAKSPAAPIYSMSSSHSSPGVWSHPPPSLHLILNILLSSFAPRLFRSLSF